LAVGAIVVLRLRGRPDAPTHAREHAAAASETASIASPPPPTPLGLVTGDPPVNAATGTPSARAPATTTAVAAAPTARATTHVAKTERTEKTQKDDTPPPSPPSGAARGQLTVICVPACDDVLDGNKSLGASPIFKRAMTAGNHHLTLKSSDPAAEKTMDVVVREDDVTVVRQQMGN
jgi:hypothetical protein